VQDSVFSTYILMTFTTIAAATSYIGADATQLASWNTFFNLPTNGTAFTGILLFGNVIELIGGKDITIVNSKFIYCDALLSITDESGCIVAMQTLAFFNCTSCTSFWFSKCTTIGNSVFYGNTATKNFYLPKLVTLGNSAETNENNFRDIIGKTVSLTVPHALMVSNLGQPDADIAYLIDNNIVTVTETN